jgi:hypothetical protein
MGSYFSTPNPDVDSRKWLVSLGRLPELDIEILVEEHGHIHTLRADIPDFPGVVIRQDPKVALAQKLDYLRWLREQIEVGVQEGLPMRVIEASCFHGGNALHGKVAPQTNAFGSSASVTFHALKWFVASCAPTEISFQLSTRFACLEESDDSLFSLTPFSEDEIRRFISKQKDSGFSYPDVGASAAAAPMGYNIDHNRALLGRGEATRRIGRWKQFARGECSACHG